MIKIDLKNIATKEDILALKKILEVENTLEMEEKMKKIIHTSLKEYLNMFLGKNVFTRGADIKEYRLLLLIQYYFDNKIPDDLQVCNLFQVKQTEARSLIGAVMSKYQYDLTDCISNTLKSIVQSVTKNVEEDHFEVNINTSNKKEELNKILGTLDGSLPPIVKKRDTGTVHIIKNSSYEKLCEHFNIHQ